MIRTVTSKEKLLRVHIMQNNETVFIFDSNLSGEVSLSVLKIAAREFIRALGKRKPPLTTNERKRVTSESECRAFRP